MVRGEVIRCTVPSKNINQREEPVEGDDLDLIEFMNQLKGGRKYSELSTWSRILLHNLATSAYKKLVSNVINMLSPEHRQSDRNEPNYTLRSAVKCALNYYDGLHFRKIIQENQDPKTFRFIRRPPHTLLLKKLVDCSDYFVQPLYQGFSVVICSTNSSTRVFSRHGELMQGLLYKTRFTENCSFEAVLLPTNNAGEFRSWRFWEFCADYGVFIVDVFRFQNEMLTHLPFYKRAQYIKKIFGVKVVDERALEKNMNSSDLLCPVVGIIYRHRLNLCDEPVKEFRYNLSGYYSFLNDSVGEFYGPISLRKNEMNMNTYINYEMARFRSVCIVYGENDSLFFVCKFDRNIFQFVHVGSIKKMIGDVAERRYDKTSLFVVNARVKTKGVLYLRVYYNEPTDINSLVGYDFKRTTSYLDIPCAGCKNDLFRLN